MPFARSGEEESHFSMIDARKSFGHASTSGLEPLSSGSDQAVEGERGGERETKGKKAADP